MKLYIDYVGPKCKYKHQNTKNVIDYVLCVRKMLHVVFISDKKNCAVANGYMD